jgi:hypothetical protein
VIETSIKREKGVTSTQQHTCTISDSVVLRIYSDTKPQNLKTADLQKGIILVHNGKELVGEGTGFGVPIAKYFDETVFSGSSFLQCHKLGNAFIIQKDFSMDLIARNKFRNFKLENVQIRCIIDYVCLLYQRHKRVAKSILLAKELLLKIGASSVFIRTAPKGKVTVTYTIDGNRIQVKVDFHQLDRRNLQKIFVLNEQGAHFFRKYTDSDGHKMTDEKIGVWNAVTAECAAIMDKKERIGFNLKNVKGTMLRRGRELMKGSLDWIGLDYELDPEHNLFNYEIEILG